MSDERCPALNPKLGIRCERKAKDCWGIDHVCIRENGLGEFWRNEQGSSPIHRFFVDWVVAKQKVTEERKTEEIESTNEDSGAQAPQSTSKPLCPICSAPLDSQRREPVTYWCGHCRKWFDGELKKL